MPQPAGSHSGAARPASAQPTSAGAPGRRLAALLFRRSLLRAPLVGGLALVAGAVLGWSRALGLLAQLLPLVANLALCLHFGATLRPGREPLIARYTRHDFGRLPPECAGYARGLTLLWTVVFAALAALHAACLPGLRLLDPPPNDAAVLAGTAALVLVLFLGEHVVRTLRFPQHGVATPWRTLRAVAAATGTRHG